MSYGEKLKRRENCIGFAEKTSNFADFLAAFMKQAGSPRETLFRAWNHEVFFISKVKLLHLWSFLERIRNCVKIFQVDKFF